MLFRSADGRYSITGPATGATSTDVGKVSKGVAYGHLTFAKPAEKNTTWCVDVTVTGGSIPAVSYSAQGGLADAACAATPTVP